MVFTGGMLPDPIRQEGVIRGGLGMLGNMMPTSILGQQIAGRATDGFSVSDVFGSLGDFATQQAYTTPVLGEALAIRAAADPDAGWIERTLGTIGVAAGVGGAAVVAGRAAQPRAFSMNSILGLAPRGPKTPFEPQIPVMLPLPIQARWHSYQAD